MTQEHLTTTLLYSKDEINFNDVSNALVNNEVKKKDQHDHRNTPSEASTARGRKMKDGKRWNSRSKSRDNFDESGGKHVDRRQIAKDECAYYHQKGH